MGRPRGSFKVVPLKQGFAREVLSLIQTCEECDRQLEWRMYFGIAEGENGLVMLAGRGNGRKKIAAFCKCGNIYYKS